MEKGKKIMCEIDCKHESCDNSIEFKPCPFCGGSVTVTRCDQEGNVCQTGKYYGLQHFAEESGLCPIAVYRENILGEQLYSSEAEAAEIWNIRA